MIASHMRVEIDSIPAIAVTHILEALSKTGINADVISTDPTLELSVPRGDGLSPGDRILSALERLVLEHAPALIPDRVGPFRYVIHPASA